MVSRWEDVGRKGGAQSAMHAVRERVVPGRLRGRLTEQGQGLVEYGLILVLIAIVAILSLIFLGGTLSSMLSNVGKSV
jgi:Flp pilus assembly pilin Flp